MKHVGDITKLSGYTLPPVDVITGGSPCQDLSIAGNRAGLDGKRSGLFMEQLRIVKELRNEDRKRGRTGEFVRPRFMVWENVPGAFSSNRGRDFQTVLTECVRIAEPSAPDVPYPEKGKWTKAGSLMGDGFSIAWRIFDAQYWGVAQRRRRIALVCDFGGQSAGEILFERESLSGNSAEGGTPGERASGGVEGGAYPAIARTLTAEHGSFDIEGRGGNVIVQGFPLGFRPENVRLYDETATTICNGTRPGFTCGVIQNAVKCLNPWDSQSGRVYDTDGVFHSLTSCENAGMQRDAVLAPVPINTMVATRHKALGRGTGFGVGEPGDPAFTISTAHSHAVFCTEAIPIHDKATRYKGGGDTRNDDGSGNGLGVGRNGDPCPTLTAADRHAVFDARGNGDGRTVNTITGDHANRVTDYTPIVARCLPANCYKQKGRENAETYISTCGIVRRLTPLECERLQGYPDRYTDIGDWTDDNGKTHKTSDSARYKALGNSIALPPWRWVLSRIAAQYDRTPTLGSLFDGIGGFSFLWEELNGKGTALWASEIEPFCIAVTKRRLGEAEQ